MPSLLLLLVSCTPHDAVLTDASWTVWLAEGTSGTVAEGLVDLSGADVLNCVGDEEAGGTCPDPFAPDDYFFGWLDDDVFEVLQDDLVPWRAEALVTSEGDFQLTLHHDLGNGQDFRIAMVFDPDFEPSICIESGQTCYTLDGDPRDDDGDGLADWEDPDCLYGGWEVGFAQASCNNGLDDDGDGLVDVDDPDCPHGWSDAERFDSTCTDGVDNDGDGWSDADDPDCFEQGAAEDGATAAFYACADGVDNDGDGLVDVFDPQCEGPYDTSEEGVSGPDPCDDTYDGDGDGWVDADDPDCELYGVEAGTLGFGCNDGVDNDGDGLVDAEDDGCANAFDPDETTPDASCLDGKDGDKDGWTDLEDPDCIFGSAEDNAFFGLTACNDGVDSETVDPSDTGTTDPMDGLADAADGDCRTALDTDENLSYSGACSDGLDNDGDGWTDEADPDCLFDIGEIGLGTTACNDGLDNDGDGLVDADDPSCGVALSGNEAVDPAQADCADGADNDGDGWIDGADPGCLVQGREASAGLPTACTNGLDDDGDGVADADDPDCAWGGDRSEGSDDPCANGADDDGDGAVDGDDPDCDTYGYEVGFAAGRCQDGRDNDGDGLVDLEDDGCDSLTDPWEEPFNECADGVDNDGDGWTDDLDPDCGFDTPYESGTWTVSQCNNGQDDDGDGMVDAGDPDCLSAYDNIEATEDPGEPVPFYMSHHPVIEEWSADEGGSSIFYLNAGTYQVNPYDAEDLWLLPQEWRSGYAIAKFSGEEFEVLPARMDQSMWVGQDPEDPDPDAYQAFADSWRAWAADVQDDLSEFGLMDWTGMELKVEDNAWRPLDASASIGLDNWLEIHHSWVRVDTDPANLVPGGEPFTGDFRVYLGGLESISQMVVHGSFEVTRIREDRWGYPVLEDQLEEQNDSLDCEFND